MKPLIELKSNAYDVIAQIQYLQGYLADLNKQIATYPKEKVVEPVIEK